MFISILGCPADGSSYFYLDVTKIVVSQFTNATHTTSMYNDIISTQHFTLDSISMSSLYLDVCFATFYFLSSNRWISPIQTLSQTLSHPPGLLRLFLNDFFGVFQSLFRSPYRSPAPPTPHSLVTIYLRFGCSQWRLQDIFFGGANFIYTNFGGG